MKRFWILPIAVFAMFFIVSCGSESNSEEKNSDPTDTETTNEEKTNDEDPNETTDTEVTDDELPHQCEDSEGRKYNEGDKIPDECLIATCMEGSWIKDAVECSPCGTEIGTKMEWTCTDGVTEVDWCECVENEESGSKWNCVERADLNCPNE